MKREEAHALARYTANVLGCAHCVCRSRINPEYYHVYTEEAALHWKGHWALTGWETEATYQPECPVEGAA